MKRPSVNRIIIGILLLMVLFKFVTTIVGGYKDNYVYLFNIFLVCINKFIIFYIILCLVLNIKNPKEDFFLFLFIIALIINIFFRIYTPFCRMIADTFGYFIISSRVNSLLNNDTNIETRFKRTFNAFFKTNSKVEPDIRDITDWKHFFNSLKYESNGFHASFMSEKPKTITNILTTLFDGPLNKEKYISNIKNELNSIYGEKNITMETDIFANNITTMLDFKYLFSKLIFIGILSMVADLCIITNEKNK